MELNQELPKREIIKFIDKSGHMDSSVWDDFEYKDSDIFVCTYAKSGTTWVQQIIKQILNNSMKIKNVHFESLWIEATFIFGGGENGKQIMLEKLNEQFKNGNRRVIKSHLPLNAIVYNKNAKYIYVVRDGRDVIMSLLNHHNSFTDEVRNKLNVGPPLDFDVFYDKFINKENNIYWNYFEHIKSWWKYKDLPNILFVHYNDLKNDLKNEIKKISNFIDFPIEDEDMLKIITKHCTFDYMKNNENVFSPPPNMMKTGSFINKGINGRWKKIMNKEQIDLYNQKCKQYWEDDCIKFINDN